MIWEWWMILPTVLGLGFVVGLALWVAVCTWWDFADDRF